MGSFFKGFYLSGFFKYAGLISFGTPYPFNGYRYLDVHLVVKPKHWQFGYKKDWYDGPLPSFGLGPLFIVCWS